MNKDISIAIIGGGASGTLTALNLLRTLKLPAHIQLIEKRSAATYRGNAYSSQLEYEPLNVQAGRMSAYSYLPNDFFDWLKINKQATSETEITKDSFVSRRWYGDYLTEQIANHVKLSQGIRFETIIDEAQHINFDAELGSYQIGLKSGKLLEANYLIFATGNEAPVDVFNQGEIAKLNGHYVNNPWAINPLDRIKNEEDILVVGTGLTMVDHVVSLQKRGHKGKIFCFSRNGYLPLPHVDVPQHYVIPFNKEQKQLAGIFSELRNQVTQATQQNIPWQNTMDAIRGNIAGMWKLLGIDAKRFFLKRLRTFWEIHRHRMPLASAKAIRELMGTGQLQIFSGTSKGIEVHGHNVIFKFVAKGQSQEQAVTVQRVINCTGPAGDYFKGGNTLIKNLLAKGWMKQDELKLGIETGERGEIIKGNGEVLENAFAIGPLRKAKEWETTAIREIRVQAEETANYIAASVEAMNGVLA